MRPAMRGSLVLLGQVVLAAIGLISVAAAEGSAGDSRFNVLSVSGSVTSRRRAETQLKFPDIIPTLYGNMLFNFRVNRGIKDKRSGQVFEYILQTPTNDTIKIWNLAQTPTSTIFEVASHTANAFQASMVGAKFVTSITTNNAITTLTLSCVAPKAATDSANDVQISLVRGLLTTMLETARMTIGVRRCNQEFSLHSGICNNVNGRGSTGVAVRYSCPSEPRLSGTKRSSIVKSRLPSPRVLSNAFCRADPQALPDRSSPVSFMFIVFGQFLDHDITLTPEGSKMFYETANIPRGNDEEKNMPEISFTRSEWLRDPKASGYLEKNHRTHFNAISAFIDASNVYGADNWRAWALRSHKDGKLLMAPDGNLPRNSLKDLPIVLRNAPDLSDNLFAAGDIRANENPVLTALHTAFALEHNRICDLLIGDLKDTPFSSLSGNDGWLYNQARKLLIGEMQNIVYEEFIPLMLGPDAMPAYRGYKAHVDPGIAVAHSTASFRFGHSGVVNDLSIRDKSGVPKRVLLNAVFFNPAKYTEYGIESWLDAAASKRAEKIDSILAPSIQDFLFNPRRAGVLDLASLNIMRTRDHGLCTYTQSRMSFGLSPDLTDIAASKRVKLLGKYRRASHVDITIGGLSETPKAGSLLGPLYHASNLDQFLRLRDGDKFFYANPKLTYGSAFRYLAQHKPQAPSLLLSTKIKAGGVRLRDVLETNTNIRFARAGSVMKM